MRLSILLIVAALCASSCNGCNKSGGKGDGGAQPDLGVRLDGGGGDGGMVMGPQPCTGTTCGGAVLCCNNSCVETASCSFGVTGVSQVSGWQNGEDWVRLKGAGFAPGMKVFIADARAPVRVVDAQNAIIKTPPGPLGAQDIKIVSGTSTAITHGGFYYRTAGLEMTWEQKPLLVVRGENPGLAVMQDGRVIIAGGTTVPDVAANSLNTAEIYNRDTDKVVTSSSMMSTPRWRNSAVTLLDGRVLVVGGACDAGGCGALPSPAQKADLYDPASDKFSPTANTLSKPRVYTHAVLLADGRVLILDGSDPSLEIFDPATNMFSVVANSDLHLFGFMVRLRDGRVLFGGGDNNPKAELFDPDTNLITPTANNMGTGESMTTAHTLPDGRVMVVAGASISAGAIQDPLTTIDVFDPATNRFSTAPFHLTTARAWHASALVRDGTILVMGGYTKGVDDMGSHCESSTANVEQIDPVAGTVMPFPLLKNTNTEWNAVTLLDGSVLGVGGGACGTTMALKDIDFLAGAPVVQ